MLRIFQISTGDPCNGVTIRSSRREERKGEWEEETKVSVLLGWSGFTITFTKELQKQKWPSGREDRKRDWSENRRVLVKGFLDISVVE